jgi:hypothetical protein
MTDKMLGNMIMHYSSNIIKLSIPYNYSQPSLLTIDGYHHVALLHSNLLELSINQCLGGGLCVISCSLVNLTSLLVNLTIYDFWSLSSEDLHSLSKLTNLEKINLNGISQLNDNSVVNYSTLTKMKSITVSYFCFRFSGLGLSNLVANKEFLVQLKVDDCLGISSEGYHCLTTLTNLTHFTTRGSKLVDFGLNMICSSCLLIEYLDIQENDHITIEGSNNIHCLIHLKSLSMNIESDYWLAKLSHNTALTQLDLGYSFASDEGLSHLSSLLFNLTSVLVDDEERLAIIM